MGLKTRDLLKLVPGTELDVIERCSGHDGTYGVKSEYFETATKICRPVVTRVQKAEADHFSSDCPMAGHMIENGLKGDREPEHPLTLLRKAYGLLTEPDQGESKMSSDGYHEPVEELSDESREMHRAIVSLMEELEAVDWYQQRVDACKDPELKAILAHNRDEEIEHAAMVLEWIRRKNKVFDKELRENLFSDKDYTDIGHHDH
jgi:uncharacterized protein